MRTTITTPCRGILVGLAEATILLSKVFDPNAPRSQLDTDLMAVQQTLQRVMADIAKARSGLTYD